MCFHSKQSKDAQELKNRFKAKRFSQEAKYVPKEEVNGFEHPFTPVITQDHPDEIQLFQWGLLPAWAKDTSFQKNTLNAMSETIHEKPSFKYITHQRCLVLANGFYEWKHHDSKGKQKEKFLIGIEQDALFAFAGLWSTWRNPTDGNEVNTYTILTTQANELMAQIHNSKKRMPIILTEKNEQDWLLGKQDFEINHQLVAKSLEPRMDLFSGF